MGRLTKLLGLVALARSRKRKPSIATTERTPRPRRPHCLRVSIGGVCWLVASAWLAGAVLFADKPLATVHIGGPVLCYILGVALLEVLKIP